MRPSTALRALAPLLALTLLAGCGDAPKAPTAPTGDDLAAATTDELVVDLKDGSALGDLIAHFPELKDANAHWNSPNVADEAIAVVRVPRGAQADLLARLRQDALVEAAEPNVQWSLPEPASAFSEATRFIPDDQDGPARSSYPNDPLYERQWNMVMVHAREAWRYASGQDVIVAVIDTGVAYEDASGKGVWAPDLKATRFVAGYDFVNDDAVAADDHGHGTHCAGTIAQSTDNGKGVIGLAPACRIMPLKVLSRQGYGTTSDIADAIRFAADNGANVLSLSLGGGGYSKILRDAVDHAHAQGCVVVCAAGNGGRAKVEYPAAYPGALAVSSVGPSGDLAFYSSHGKETFIAAPGGDQRRRVEDGVLQNTLDPRTKGRTVYAYFQGTSMATPHVAAASALLYECGVTDPDAIASILATTARGDGWNQRFGHGVLDAGAAVRHAIFVPSCVALALAGLGVFLCTRRVGKQDLSRGLLALGALAGASGLFFLRPLGLGELPLGGLLTRSVADWDIALLGASWHWNALFASALIPSFVALLGVKLRFTRSLGVGLVLGWAASLATGVVLPYADVRWIPGHGILDALWLGTNALVLVGVAAALVRLGRVKRVSL